MSLLVVENQSDEHCLLDATQLSDGDVDENVDADHGRLLVLLLAELDTFSKSFQRLCFKIDAADKALGEWLTRELFRESFGQ